MSKSQNSEKRKTKSFLKRIVRLGGYWGLPPILLVFIAKLIFDQEFRNSVDMFLSYNSVPFSVYLELFLQVIISQLTKHWLPVFIIINLLVICGMILLQMSYIRKKRHFLRNSKQLAEEQQLHAKAKSKQINEEKTFILRDPKPSTFKSILIDETLRCMYTDYYPFSSREGRDVEPTGIAIDILKEIANRLEVKPSWVRIVDWSDIHRVLRNGECDIVSYVWRTDDRMKLSEFLFPFHSSRIGAYVRTADTKLGHISTIDELKAAIEQETPKINTYKGEISETLANGLFKGGFVTPIKTPFRHQDQLNNLKDELIDIAFIEPFVAYKFQKNSPDLIANVLTKDPIILPGSFMIKKGDPRLRDQLNYILMDLLAEGFIENRFVDVEASKYERGVIYSQYHPRIGQVL